MTAPERCATVQGRLVESLLAGEAPAEVDRQHAARCAACGAAERSLYELAHSLSEDAPPGASDALVHVTLARARRELERRDAARAAPPSGWRREVGRLLGVALLPLPLVLAWNAAVLSLGGALLGGVVPSALLDALAAGYVLAGATWLAFLYGSLPLVAHRKLRRRVLEAAS